MNTALTSSGEPRPSVSFSTLAKIMSGMSMDALRRILLEQKRASPEARNSYQFARQQGVDFLVDGAPFNPDAVLRPYERDAVHAMARMPNLRVPRAARATRPKTARTPWRMHGVDISMEPDVELEGRAGGAVKFAFTKRRLAEGVGQTMASLLWYWKAMVLADKNVQRSHCIVYEPRLPWIHIPAKRPYACVDRAETACRIIRAVWPTL